MLNPPFKKSKTPPHGLRPVPHQTVENFEDRHAYFASMSKSWKPVEEKQRGLVR